MKNIINNINFILGLENSISFKFLYLLDKIVGKFLGDNKQRFIKGDYVLNSDFSWTIKSNSDFDYIARPNYESELIPYFTCNGIFLDVGAHMGKWSLYMSRIASEVYSFEPNPDTFKYLNTNVMINGIKNIHTINKAVSNKEGTVCFNAVPNDTGASMISQDGIEVQCTTLDTFTESFERIGLIKLDTQGEEWNILSSSPNTLRKTDKIICEIWDKTKEEMQQIFDLMNSFGFKIEKLPTDIDYLFQK